jgi:hypothetical protein
VLVNEVLADPAGPDPGGEFVELVNAGATPVALSGWRLGDAVDPARHVFRAGEVLPPGRARVVFDAGAHGGVPGALVASSGALSLDNQGEVVTLYAADGTVVDSVLAGALPEGTSANRARDGVPGAELVPHHQVPGAAGTASPGTRADGGEW